MDLILSFPDGSQLPKHHALDSLMFFDFLIYNLYDILNLRANVALFLNILFCSINRVESGKQDEINTNISETMLNLLLVMEDRNMFLGDSLSE